MMCGADESSIRLRLSPFLIVTVDWIKFESPICTSEVLAPPLPVPGALFGDDPLLPTAAVVPGRVQAASETLARARSIKTIAKSFTGLLCIFLHTSLWAFPASLQSFFARTYQIRAFALPLRTRAKYARLLHILSYIIGADASYWE